MCEIPLVRRGFDPEKGPRNPLGALRLILWGRGPGSLGGKRNPCAGYVDKWIDVISRMETFRAVRVLKTHPLIPVCSPNPAGDRGRAATWGCSSPPSPVSTSMDVIATCTRWRGLPGGSQLRKKRR